MFHVSLVKPWYQPEGADYVLVGMISSKAGRDYYYVAGPGTMNDMRAEAKTITYAGQYEEYYIARVSRYKFDPEDKINPYTLQEIKGRILTAANK